MQGPCYAIECERALTPERLVKSFLRNNQSGTSIVEVLVAGAIVSITFYSMVTMFTSYGSLIGKIGGDKAQYFSVANFRESVLANPAQVQMAENEYEAEILLAPDQLPWFLNANLLVTRATCTVTSTCAQYNNRVGYVLYPHPSGAARNIYTLKIRMHDVKNNYSKDFEYLVAPK